MSKNISFYIAKNRADKRGLVPIYAQVTIKSRNQPFMIEKIKPRYWNPAKQRVYKNRENESYNRHKEINSLLDRLSLDTTRLNRFDNYPEPPKREDVKSVLLNINSDPKSFNDAYTEFIETNRNKFAYNTTKGQITARNFIAEYQKYYSKELRFDDIDLNFFDKLYDYAFDVRDFETNTFASYTAKFKTFLNWANEKGYHTGIEYKKYFFAEKEKSVICLTPDEFKTLYNYNFENKRLDKARDLYCFGCLTGLRFSDIETLRYEHFKDGFISKRITKTKQDALIPILPQAQKIIDKYNTGGYYPLPKISNQKLNDNIKDCCKEAGINTPTAKIINKGNQYKEEVQPKYKYITVHTARKTFITIGFMNGMDVKIIKSITGHKKDSTFDKYLKIADEMKKEQMLKAWNNV